MRARRPYRPTVAAVLGLVTCGFSLVLLALLGGCQGDDTSEPSDSRSGNERADRARESSQSSRPRPHGSEPAAPTGARPRRGASRAEGFAAAPVLVEPRTPRASMERGRQMSRAQSLPHTRQAGCHRAAFPLAGGRVIWGPPAPRIVTARRSGKRITIRFAFERLPRSLGCRPAAVTVSVLSGELDTPSFRFSDRRFRVVGPRASATLRVPAGGRLPYTARIQAFTLDGRPSRHVKALVK